MSINPTYLKSLCDSSCLKPNQNSEADKCISITISSATTRTMFKAKCLLLDKSAKKDKIRCIHNFSTRHAFSIKWVPLSPQHSASLGCKRGWGVQPKIY